MSRCFSFCSFAGEKPLGLSAYPASVPWCHPREPRSSHATAKALRSVDECVNKWLLCGLLARTVIAQYLKNKGFKGDEGRKDGGSLPLLWRMGDDNFDCFYRKKIVER